MATAKKSSKAQRAARQKVNELRNPVTGTGPNQFTAAGQGRTLPPPKNVRPYERPVTDRRRMRKMAVEKDAQVDAPVGYRMDAIGGDRPAITTAKEARAHLKRNPGSNRTVQDVLETGPQGGDRYKTFITGAQHMFPNTAAEKGVAAIDEPHKHEPGVTVQRRVEDLSGKEYRKGKAVLKHFGYDPRDPVGHLQQTHERTLDRVTAEHMVAGVNESSSQLFYGGHVTTDFPDIEHAITHEEHVRETPDLFDSKVDRLVKHPEFVNATAHLSHPERVEAARNLMASAASDTSPNSKWKDPQAKRTHPNLDQAEEAVHASLEGRRAAFIAGRPGNVDKAGGRIADATSTGNYEVHQYGDPNSAPKTIGFRGALINKDSPDAFQVSDVHHASVAAPWLPTQKAHKYRDPTTGKRESVYPDQPASATKGKVQEFVATPQGKVRPDWGLSRPEQMLAEGAPIIHAMNDYASRRVLASRGLSRGVNYADNVHTYQAAAWGSQQMRRPDLPSSPAEQYPVVRHWAGEGVSVPKNPEKPLQSLLRGETHDQLGVQFHRNPKTGKTQSVFDLD